MRIIAIATAVSLAITTAATAQTTTTASPSPPGVSTNPTAASAVQTAPSAAPSAQTLVAAPQTVNLNATPPLAGGGGRGGSITTIDGIDVPVFGTELFSGAIAGSRPGDRPDYRIQPGDQISDQSLWRAHGLGRPACRRLRQRLRPGGGSRARRRHHRRAAAEHPGGAGPHLLHLRRGGLRQRRAGGIHRGFRHRRRGPSRPVPWRQS